MGVGEGAVQSIMEERAKNGPYTGIFDFVQRVNLNACNKKNLECLALAGGFDSFPELKREQYFAVNTKNEVFIETLVRYGNRYQADKAAAVNSLHGTQSETDITFGVHGTTELYFKVTDPESKMTLDLVSRPVKLSVGRELISYLPGFP